MDFAETNFEMWCSDHTQSQEEIARVLAETLDALGYAHDQGVIHRDVKPGNILMRRNRQTNTLHACVADFGLCVLVNRDTTMLTKTQQALGTLAFLSPEQADDARSVDKRTDIYSLGKVLYWALTKRIPFPDFVVEKVPSRFRHIVRKACESEPKDRYQSAQEFKTALLAVVAPEDPFTPESADVAKLCEQIGEGTDPAKLSKLAQVLAVSKDDTQVLSRVVPSISPQIWSRMLVLQPDAVDTVLLAYDESVSGGLPFERCDKVADFYRRLWGSLDSLKYRQMFLRRLLDMGYSHDRYYVRGVFGKLIERIEQPELVYFVAELFKDNPRQAEWIAGGNNPGRWPRMIQQAIPKPEQAQPPTAAEVEPQYPADDDILF